VLLGWSGVARRGKQNRTGSSANYWVDDTYTLDSSTTVVANEPVVIYLKAELDVLGQSSHAIADGDFFTGADKFIRVPQIWVDLQLFPVIE
jgi:hypothetical protein